MTMNSTSPNDWLSMFNSGKYSLIVSSYKSLVAEKFDNDIQPVQKYVLAAAFCKVGDYMDAYILINDIEPFLSGDAEFLSLAGIVNRRLGKFNEAKNYLELALELNPSSLSIKNNYANLLIDLNETDKAKLLLDEILLVDPLFQDAIDNLRRLQERNSISNISGSFNYSSSSSWHPADPLTLAFTNKEVELSSIKPISKPDSNEKKLYKSIPDLTNSEAGSDYLKIALKAVEEKQFDFALKICTKALSSLGAHPGIYDCIGDSYLGKKDFHRAEHAVLVSLLLGSSSIKTYINLFSFACMRSDFSLAEALLDKITLLDQSNPNLSVLKKQLASIDKSSFKLSV